jgi:hypothetical protein
VLDPATERVLVGPLGGTVSVSRFREFLEQAARAAQAEKSEKAEKVGRLDPP